jgi:hypothetical protein
VYQVFGGEAQRQWTLAAIADLAIGVDLGELLCELLDVAAGGVELEPYRATILVCTVVQKPQMPLSISADAMLSPRSGSGRAPMIPDRGLAQACAAAAGIGGAQTPQKRMAISATAQAWSTRS